MNRSKLLFHFVVALVLSVLIRVTDAGAGVDFFHTSPDPANFQAGWQEPGLWRPKWIMERTFIDKTTGKVLKKDKVVFKLKQDRTMKIFHGRAKRPFLEIMKRKNTEEKKRKLFETGKEEISTIEERAKKAKGCKP